ncbi:MAG: alpha/beta hydrolase [Thermoplasmata archaeon]
MTSNKIIKWITATRLRIVLVVVSVVLLIITAGFLTWALTPLGPMDGARDALKSDSEVKVSTDGRLVFEPSDGNFDTGFIFYPGGRVDPRSYAPMARDIARYGFLVVIVPMRLNLAFFSPDRASVVMGAYPGVDTWAVGGHSLGGAMAARFVHKNGADGLILWAAYPADDMSADSVPTLLIYGSSDGVTSPDDLHGRSGDMPSNTTWVSIEGGNHAQFGWYGSQRGDNDATISRGEQQELIVANTVEFMRSL